MATLQSAIIVLGSPWAVDTASSWDKRNKMPESSVTGYIPFQPGWFVKHTMEKKTILTMLQDIKDREKETPGTETNVSAYIEYEQDHYAKYVKYQFSKEQLGLLLEAINAQEKKFISQR